MLNQEVTIQNGWLEDYSSPEEASQASTEGFMTGEQLITSSQAKLEKLKAMYRQQLGFDAICA
ncbi:hypothetical protein [Sabulibacter ruber]|uniref:hypothetical protein n=1 Tax=Sabulibacter ruber TaxID=2811901 RepID=UPI001A956A91|nr:hypothetical protein [Sabulibacter ruber]